MRRLLRKATGTSRTSRSRRRSPVEQVLGPDVAATVLTGVLRGVFGIGRR